MPILPLRGTLNDVLLKYCTVLNKWDYLYLYMCSKGESGATKERKERGIGAL